MDDNMGTLLFVDDETSILKTLRRLFIPLGYEVHIAPSGAEGLQILEDNQVDLVMSDMRMPEMDGAEFLKHVAEKWPQTKRVLLTGYAELESAVSAINDGKIDYYLNKPWKDEQLETTIATCLEAKKLKEQNRELESKIVAQNAELKSLNASLEDKVQQRTAELDKAYSELQQTYQSSMQVLSTLVDMHQVENRGHCRQIATLAKQLAIKLKLDESQTQDIYFASLLHGIGKIGMPEAILTQAAVSLSPEQTKSLCKYPLLGEAALMAFEPLKPVAQIIATHREYFDGSGYPDKQAGEDISVGARIVCLVVDYLELQAGLQLEGKLTAAQALEFITKSSGKRYDPQLVDLFQQIIAELPEQQEKLDELVLSAKELQEDMMLTKDLLTDNGILLLPKGEQLTKAQIDKLKSLENIVAHVKVIEPPEEQVE